MNTFDLKGSRFKRKVILEEEYDQIWGSTSHMSQNSNVEARSAYEHKSRDLLPDQSQKGTQINRENITDKLRLAEEVKKRKSVDSENASATRTVLSPRT